MEFDIGQLEHAIGYRFNNLSFVQTALSHRSYVNEVRDEISDNQRLEFLGDSVLGIIIAEELFRRHPNSDEGFLSGVQATLVCEPALFDVAVRIDLGRFLRLGRGEELSGGRQKPSLLADAYEALLAAIYLDGGIESARSVVVKLHRELLERPRRDHSPEDDKSKLQRITQSGSTSRPAYAIVDERGPAHARIFVAEVTIEGKIAGRGEGKTKKIAQQKAALAALAFMDD